jgi:hypothetical protein
MRALRIVEAPFAADLGAQRTHRGMRARNDKPMTHAPAPTSSTVSARLRTYASLFALAGALSWATIIVDAGNGLSCDTIPMSRSEAFICSHWWLGFMIHALVTFGLVTAFSRSISGTARGLSPWHLAPSVLLSFCGLEWLNLQTAPGPMFLYSGRARWIAAFLVAVASVFVFHLRGRSRDHVGAAEQRVATDARE